MNKNKKKEKYTREDFIFDISNMIIESRIHRGMTQSELAKQTGLKQPSIARIESEDHLPNISTLYKIARALNFDLSINFIEQETKDKLSDPLISHNSETETLEVSPVSREDSIPLSMEISKVLEQFKVSENYSKETDNEKLVETKK